MEELKKLARAWKLNEQRNFWKTHSDNNTMVAALLQHAEESKKYTIAEPIEDNTVTEIIMKPQPPEALLASKYIRERKKQTETSVFRNFFENSQTAGINRYTTIISTNNVKNTNFYYYFY